MDDDFYYNYLHAMLHKKPVNPLLYLICNGKTLISHINVNNSMENAYTTVMIEEGANCTMGIQNTTIDAIEVADTAIFYINYTIFHGDKTSLDQNPVVIFSGQTESQ